MSDTPLMLQYRQMKKQYSEMILFFRLGDFYEMFDDDAVEVSSLLGLTLTHKGDSPMCGIPYHAVRIYIKRLLGYGKKIAVCEQLELADSSKSLAKREVVRVITPATVVEEDFLDDRSFNYILSIFQSSCAYCDISTGDFRLRHFESNDKIQDIRSVIEQTLPSEILVCEDEYFMDGQFKSVIDSSRAMVTKLPPWNFNVKKAYSILCETAGVSSLSSFGLEANDRILGPAGALMNYIKETSKSDVSHLCDYKVDENSSFVSVDEASRRNLELFRNLYDGSSSFSLFDAVNRCRTSSGTRLLKNYISFPLHDINKINYRQDWVQWFYDNPAETKRVRDILSSSMDLKRLSSRFEMRKAVPHDLVAVKQSLASLFEIVSKYPEKYSPLADGIFDGDTPSRLSSLMSVIDAAVEESFLGQFSPGNVIRSGYSEELDQARSLHEHGSDAIKQYVETEKQKTGISVIKLGYNHVFGYFIEVPKGQLSKVPDYFNRKQTLVNGERFTTEELIQFEQRILTSESEAENLEKRIYQELLDRTLVMCKELNLAGSFLAVVDVYSSLAFLAAEMNYVRPIVTDDNCLEITEGRHPVVERQLSPGSFVPNSLSMDVKFSLITGPNMAGKSTFLRQNALIVLLAHIGSFVPATKARIGLADKIFCRVGAMDNLARGESTFMLEMQETAFILRSCSERSFVIVDEIGRGTSTQDGMSIAYAVMRQLVRNGCRTLFATHYHELTMMDVHDIRLLTLDVFDNGREVRFLRSVKEGVANSSYGIHVAKLAGIPAPVVREAKSFQNRHFADYTMQQDSLFSVQCTTENEQTDSNDALYRDVAKKIEDTDIDSLTPVQAIILLSGLKNELMVPKASI